MVSPGPGFPATHRWTRPARAPFSKERRMKLAKATKFHRKSGGGTAEKGENGFSRPSGTTQSTPVYPGLTSWATFRSSLRDWISRPAEEGSPLRGWICKAEFSRRFASLQWSNYYDHIKWRARNAEDSSCAIQSAVPRCDGSGLAKRSARHYYETWQTSSEAGTG